MLFFQCTDPHLENSLNGQTVRQDPHRLINDILSYILGYFLQIVTFWEIYSVHKMSNVGAGRSETALIQARLKDLICISGITVSL